MDHDLSASIRHGYRDDGGLRRSFEALAERTFGLDFENWYQNGFWGDAYDPYSIVLDGRIVSNVSVNRIDGTLSGKPRRYLQLGTVMTEEACRGRGWNRRLMEAVLDQPSDGVFLYANDSVLDYYPKFGFRPWVEYRYRLTLADGGENAALPVPMETQDEWKRFLMEKRRRASAGVFQLVTDGLLMFYLSQFMREAVYYLPELGAYVIAEPEGETLTVYDVYSSRPVRLSEVCRSFGPAIRQAEFAFTPEDRTGLTEYEHHEEDTTLFILGDSLVRDMEMLRGFPALAHA